MVLAEQNNILKNLYLGGQAEVYKQSMAKIAKLALIRAVMKDRNFLNRLKKTENPNFIGK